MKKTRTRLGSIVLAVAMLLSLLPVSALAAKSDHASQALRDTAYLGDYRQCRMTSAMAVAYANALSGLPAASQGLLVDLNQDGIPLLFTSKYDSNGFADYPTIWTWDGQMATAYPFDKDLEFYPFVLELGKYQGQAAIRVGDGCATQLGEASGSVYYTISQAKLTLVHQEMMYSAYRRDSATACGEKLPLVNALVDAYGGEYAPISELLQAGWTLSDDGFGLTLCKVNGEYSSCTSEQELLEWEANHSATFQANEDQPYFESTGSADLQGKWDSVGSLRQALLAYAKQAAQAEGEFIDVPMDHYAYTPIHWAVEKGITNGSGTATFSPNASCTRGQMVTFLWRAAGSPKTTGKNPFTDVKADAYYYDAVLWAVQKGITTGATETTFGPEATVTRGQTATFLYRNAGAPAASGDSFNDVPANAYYAKAVAWAVAEGITNGTSDTTFSPEADCTRGQIVTFLYRDAQ